MPVWSFWFGHINVWNKYTSLSCIISNVKSVSLDSIHGICLWNRSSAFRIWNYIVPLRTASLAKLNSIHLTIHYESNKGFLCSLYKWTCVFSNSERQLLALKQPYSMPQLAKQFIMQHVSKSIITNCLLYLQYFLFFQNFSYHTWWNNIRKFSHSWLKKEAVFTRQ